MRCTRSKMPTAPGCGPLYRTSTDPPAELYEFYGGEQLPMRPDLPPHDVPTCHVSNRVYRRVARRILGNSRMPRERMLERTGDRIYKNRSPIFARPRVHNTWNTRNASTKYDGPAAYTLIERWRESSTKRPVTHQKYTYYPWSAATRKVRGRDGKSSPGGKFHRSR